MTEEYMINGAFFAAGVLSMAVWHGVHVWMSNKSDVAFIIPDNEPWDEPRPEKDVYGLYAGTDAKPPFVEEADYLFVAVVGGGLIAIIAMIIMAYVQS